MLKKTIYAATAAAVLLAVLSFALYRRSGSGLALTLAITFGVTAFHFVMRLAVGLSFNAAMKNRAASSIF